MILGGPIFLLFTYYQNFHHFVLRVDFLRFPPCIPAGNFTCFECERLNNDLKPDVLVGLICLTSGSVILDFLFTTGISSSSSSSSVSSKSSSFDFDADLGLVLLFGPTSSGFDTDLLFFT